MNLEEMQKHGAEALVLVRKRLLRGKPEACHALLDDQWQMLTRLSWSVAARVPREPYVYAAIGRRAMQQIRDALLVRAEGKGIVHVERWMQRHEGWLASLGAEMAEHVDAALNFPGCFVIRDVSLDRRGRIMIHERAEREPDPDEPPPAPPRRRPRALVPDERVTERQLDALAATMTPSEIARELLD
jgi:hypothetical protein